MTGTTNPLSLLHSDPTGSTLGLALPPGDLLDTTTEGHWPEPLLWRCDTPPAERDWTRLRTTGAMAGLYPILLGGERLWRTAGSESQVWNAELDPGRSGSPDRFTSEALLGKWWADYAVPDPEEDHLDPAERLEILAPFTAEWPGLAAPGLLEADPDQRAAQVVQAMLDNRILFHPRLGLVPVGRGADVLAAIGWTGPLNYDNDSATFSTVLRSREERFGVRVVALTHDVLHLSVAAPPTTFEHALAVAAEHFAFCPDNVWQSHHTTLRAYAAHAVLGRQHWEFWWD